MEPETDDNPYAVPESVRDAQADTPHDRFILDEVAPMLRPKERVRFTAVLVQAPSPVVLLGTFLAVGVLGGVLAFALSPLPVPPPLLGGVGGMLGAMLYMLATRPYLAAVTTRRIVLFRTSLGMFGVKQANLGTEELRWRDIERIDVGGFANNRSLRFVFRDGQGRTLRISPWLQRVSGQKAFFEFAQQYVSKPPRD